MPATPDGGRRERASRRVPPKSGATSLLLALLLRGRRCRLRVRCRRCVPHSRVGSRELTHYSSRRLEVRDTPDARLPGSYNAEHLRHERVPLRLHQGQ